MACTDPLPILFDDAGLFIVDKPHGLDVTAPPSGESVITRLREQLGLDPEDYLTAIHRLDRPTAGLLMVARKKSVAKLMSQQFVARRVGKEYHAEVRGRVEIDDGETTWIDGIAKRRGVAAVDVVDLSHEHAKRAETVVRVIEHSSATTRLSVRPLTGRMHQIRAQAARRGHPVVGDTLYDPARSEDPPSVPAAAGNNGSHPSNPVDAAPIPRRVELTAEQLTFFHPRTAASTTVRRVPPRGLPADGGGG